MTYPLLYRFANLIVHGRGFAAEVRAEGRAVAENGDAQWRLRSVEMGGLAGAGLNPHEAFDHLRSRFVIRLFTLAEEMVGYEEFVARASRAFVTADEIAERDFCAAIEAIGRGLGRDGGGVQADATSLCIERLARTERRTAAANLVDAMVVLDRRSWQRREEVSVER